MVSFTPAGRFGNWFMEAATCISYALKHDLELSFPTQHGREKFWNPTYCHHLVHPSFNLNLEAIRLWENGHQYQELPFEESWRNKNIIIEGYRQSEKYFKQHREEILYLLGFKWEMKEGAVSIHVRRGDYLHLQEKHILYSIEYMRKATSYFYNLGYDHFKVFSDDIAWCKVEFAKEDFAAFKIEFSTNENEVDDAVEISCCEHNINSSSTFAWTGAWMNKNPNKIIITPEKWFQDGWMGLDTSDIVPNEWIKM